MKFNERQETKGFTGVELEVDGEYAYLPAKKDRFTILNDRND